MWTASWRPGLAGFWELTVADVNDAVVLYELTETSNLEPRPLDSFLEALGVTPVADTTWKPAPGGRLERPVHPSTRGKARVRR